MHTQIMWPLFYEMMDDWSDPESLATKNFILSPEGVGRRQHVLRTLSHMDRALCSIMIQAVHNLRRTLVQNYADIFSGVLKMESNVACAFQLSDLMELMCSEGKKPLDGRRRFEAVSIFDQAAFVAAIESDDSLDNIGRDLKEMLGLLQENWFVGSRDITVWTRHDPKDYYRVKGQPQIDEPMKGNLTNVRRREMTCRVLKGGDVAHLDHRLKDAATAMLKILRQQQNPDKSQPFQVRDRCGFKFSLPTVDQAYRACASLRRLLEKHGAVLTEVQGNLNGNGQRKDANNPQSSPYYKALSFNAVWHDRSFEFQIVTFKDLFSSEHALNDENHELYKLRQFLTFIFPLFFPPAHYGIEWSDRKVRKRLFRSKTRQLGWRVKS